MRHPSSVFLAFSNRMIRDCSQLRFAALPFCFCRTAKSNSACPRFAGPWSGAVLALLLICGAPRQGVCQFARQPALLARPASVLLIARVESVSLAAVSTAEVSSLSFGGAQPVEDNVSITARWALPSNLTTLRVTAYSGASVANSPVGSSSMPNSPQPSSPVSGSQEAVHRFSFVPQFTAARSGQTIWLQGSGDSNRAAARTDQLQVPRGTSNGDPKFRGKSNASKSQILMLVVQAL